MKKIGLIITFLCAACFASIMANAQVAIGVSVNIAPPALPVYEQPECPVEGYLWVPGYWAYNADGGYYWVPGYWSAPPRVGLLWTPAYWGFEGGAYGFHAGYWGEHVGFYGGINYGFGYGGVGFGGGNWVGGRFRYNTAVLRVNTTIIHNTYVDRTVINVNVNNHASFNGRGGVEARPRAEELAAMREQHVQPTARQLNHQQHAAQDKSQFAKNNGGHPTAAAMDRMGGKPVNEHGEAATNSKLGNKNPNANKNIEKPNGGGEKPNGGAGAHQQRAQPQRPGGQQQHPGGQQRAQPQRAGQQHPQPQHPQQPKPHQQGKPKGE